jgi:hypothetical protein
MGRYALLKMNLQSNCFFIVMDDSIYGYVSYDKKTYKFVRPMRESSGFKDMVNEFAKSIHVPETRTPFISIMFYDSIPNLDMIFHKHFGNIDNAIIM